MTYLKISILSLLLLSVQVSVVFGQSNTVINVDEAVTSSERYHNKKLCIKGSVSSKAAVFGYGGFFLAGENKRLLVVTGDNPPPENTMDIFCGIFKQAATVSSWSFNLLIHNKG
ncbi:MAG: hypothetical protein KGV46_00680 [Pasteurella sp.]|nr:hypothetical protein [Pasteurella sp.]